MYYEGGCLVANGNFDLSFHFCRARIVNNFTGCLMCESFCVFVLTDIPKCSIFKRHFQFSACFNETKDSINIFIELEN